MKPNWYALFQRALEEGAEMGWNRAYKHTDNPPPEIIKSEIVEHQLQALCEIVLWDKGEE